MQQHWPFRSVIRPILICFLLILMVSGASACHRPVPLDLSTVLVPNKAKRAVDELLAAFRVQNLATIFLLMRDRDGSEFTPEGRQVVEDNLQQAAAFFRYDHWEILQVWAMTPDRYQLRVRLHYTDAPSMDANIVVENLYDEWKITAFVQLIE
jgi:hypothetical protein